MCKAIGSVLAVIILIVAAMVIADVTGVGQSISVLSPCYSSRAACYVDSAGNKWCGYPGQTNVLCGKQRAPMTLSNQISVIRSCSISKSGGAINFSVSLKNYGTVSVISSLKSNATMPTLTKSQGTFVTQRHVENARAAVDPLITLGAAAGHLGLATAGVAAYANWFIWMRASTNNGNAKVIHKWELNNSAQSEKILISLHSGVCGDFRASCYIDPSGKRWCGYPGQTAILCGKR